MILFDVHFVCALRLLLSLFRPHLLLPFPLTDVTLCAVCCGSDMHTPASPIALAVPSPMPETVYLPVVTCLPVGPCCWGMGGHTLPLSPPVFYHACHSLPDPSTLGLALLPHQLTPCYYPTDVCVWLYSTCYLFTPWVVGNFLPFTHL